MLRLKMSSDVLWMRLWPAPPTSSSIPTTITVKWTSTSLFQCILTVIFPIFSLTSLFKQYTFEEYCSVTRHDTININFWYGVISAGMKNYKMRIAKSDLFMSILMGEEESFDEMESHYSSGWNVRQKDPTKDDEEDDTYRSIEKWRMETAVEP